MSETFFGQDYIHTSNIPGAVVRSDAFDILDCPFCKYRLIALNENGLKGCKSRMGEHLAHYHGREVISVLCQLKLRKESIIADALEKETAFDNIARFVDEQGPKWLSRYAPTMQRVAERFLR